MKEYKLDFNTFMGGWFMPENVVDSVLNWAERNNHKLAPGLIGGGKVIKDYKDSYDIKIHDDDYHYAIEMKVKMKMYVVGKLTTIEQLGLSLNSSKAYMPVCSPAYHQNCLEAEAPTTNCRQKVELTVAECRGILHHFEKASTHDGIAHSLSSALSLAPAFSTLTLSWAARSMISFLLREETLCAISAA